MRLGNAWTGDTLPACRPPRFGERRDPNGPSPLRRFVERLHDPDVLQSFLARWFRLAVVLDAVGKVKQFRGELIVLANPFSDRLSVYCRDVLEPLGILIGGIDMHMAFRADDAVG